MNYIDVIENTYNKVITSVKTKVNLLVIYSIHFMLFANYIILIDISLNRINSKLDLLR